MTRLAQKLQQQHAEGNCPWQHLSSTAAPLKFARDLFDMPRGFSLYCGRQRCGGLFWQRNFRRRPLLRIGRRGGCSGLMTRCPKFVSAGEAQQRFRVRLLQMLLGKACEKLLGPRTKSFILPDLPFQLIEHNLCEWKQQQLRKTEIPRREPRSTAVDVCWLGLVSAPARSSADAPAAPRFRGPSSLKGSKIPPAAALALRDGTRTLWIG